MYLADHLKWKTIILVLKKCQLLEENFEYVLKQSLQATQNYKLQVSESLFDLSQLSASRFSKEGSDQSRLV